MKERMTRKKLEGSVRYLNQVTGSPTEMFAGDGSRNVGHFYIEKSYTNTYHLSRLRAGGEVTVLRCDGSRSFYDALRAYIDGWRDCLETVEPKDAQ